MKIGRQSCRQIDIQMGTHCRQTGRQTDWKANIQADRQSRRHTVKETDSQVGMHTERQTDKIMGD